MRVVLCFFFLAVAPVFVSSQSSSAFLTPTAYHLKINVPDLSTASTFNGSVTINITVETSTYKIELHAENLTVDSDSVRVMRRREWDDSWVSEALNGVNTEGSALVISTLQELNSETDYRVSLDFQGHFQNTMAGFAKIGYHFRRTPKYLGVASLDPTHARSVFPCFDVPKYRTHFLLDITVDKSQHVLSNVWPTYIRNVTNTTEVFRFSTSSMAVSQVSWVVFEQATFLLQTENSTDSNTVVHTRAPYPYSNHTSWASQLTARLLAEVANYTSTPYPLTKLEQIVIPEFFSGTSEGWGIISYSEEAILVTPERTSAQDTQRVGLDLARGVAQQWFGDLISISSWENVWLMKGLAEYLKYPISASQAEMSSWELNEQIGLELMQKALAADSSQHALSLDLQDEAALVRAASDDLTKYKGGAVVRMLHDVLGDVFESSLEFLFKKHSSKAVEPSTFWSLWYGIALDSNVDLDGKSVAELVSKWASEPGYPVLDVTWDGSRYTISQHNNTGWYVRVSYTLQTSPGVVTKAWLEPGQTLLVDVSSPQWILLNINQTGLYRVNYNSSLWQLLSVQLTTDLTQVPRLSRAQLIDDVFSLTMTGALSTDFLLQFTGFLRAETDYYPWHTALRNFQDLVDKFYGHSSYDLLRTHVLSLMVKVIDEVGMAAKAQDSHVDKLRRATVLERACALGHPDCLLRASRILLSWRKQLYFDADLSTALLCAGVSNSSTEMWWEVWNMYQYSVFPTVRAAILRALPCSTDQPLLKEFLNNVTSTGDPVVSSKDKTIILQTLASTPAGAELLLGWLVDKLNAQINTTTSQSNNTSSESSIEVPSSSSAESNATSSNSSLVREIGPNSGEASVEGNQEDIPSTALVRRARAVTSTGDEEPLSEEDVAAILSYIVPKLTTVEQGTKLDGLAAKNGTGLSNATLETMRGAALQVYMNSNWADSYNAKISVWLQEAATTSASSGTSDPSSSATSSPTDSSQSPSGASALHSCLVLALLALVPALRLSL